MINLFQLSTHDRFDELNLTPAISVVDVRSSDDII